MRQEDYNHGQNIGQGSEFSWNYGTFINNHVQHRERKTHQGENRRFFLLEIFKIAF